MLRFFKSVGEQKHDDQLAKLYRELIRREATMGGQLFGPVPSGVRREFFCLDEHTWVWHEEWTDKRGKRQIFTTRYDIRPSGILKTQNGQNYQRTTPEESRRLSLAARLYIQKARSELYHVA